MKIKVTPVWCYVEGIEKEIKWLSKILRISKKIYVNGKYKTCYRSLFFNRKKRFLTGLLKIVLRKSKLTDIKIEVEDTRVVSVAVLPLSRSLLLLYDYQKNAIEAALKNKNGILKLPTAAGKTHIAVGIATRVAGRTLMLCHEISLVNQAINRYEKLTGELAGKITVGNFDVQDFTIATMQSLRSGLENKDQRFRKYIDSVDCLIVDECHILGARTHYKTAISIQNTSFRIGLSATPLGRSDGMDAFVVGAIGPIIYEVGHETLIRSGRIAKSTIVFYEYPNQKIICVPAAKWNKLYDIGIVRNEARNRAIVKLCEIAKPPIMIFYERKAHGYILLAMLRELGYSVKIVHGHYSEEDRSYFAKILNDGKIDVLLCSKIFTAGVDIPNIRTVINAAGQKAVIPNVQRYGRGKRIGEEKDRFVYFDFYDKGHGVLERHSEERQSHLEDYDGVTVCDNLKTIANSLLKEL